MAQPIQNRYEFTYLFDVAMGNPNGDPDAGNMPRLDYQTNHGLVTDVCLKRKVRNYVDLVRADLGVEDGLNIYVREKGVLNRENEQAYKALGLKPDSKLPKDEAKARELTAWMCANFFDIRAFGAVMTTEVNCGQVRGPVQLTFAKSIEEVHPQEIAITRMAVTNEKDAEKERTIGRKHILRYGLYRCDGFISAHLAERTGFSDDDLALLWKALVNMFDHDRSAARGIMSARKLIVFKHASKLGDAPAPVLFDAIDVKRVTEGPANSFKDYAVAIDRAAIPAGVEPTEIL
ncbi:type I-C CRISPR-associated protein Cas7/Csd2 [Magnetospirillum aberrantis]|uniref:Type I-C CRISPR-associated protein Cas7/Csd2 n=1 Tax=Magnetospirillum aberrantis SpK TaxID=908842 RepID=A0A7C9QT02_9PROT|nr:type I-C CRISPR-associated protein Cas7/Csd2 [Magnetospirillum aberrantis]NFV79537.1 type I-C CRISPR-associated protein Cas7/Csd2 [Magnetospirillum aberrantis SpK]